MDVLISTGHQSLLFSTIISCPSTTNKNDAFNVIAEHSEEGAGERQRAHAVVCEQRKAKRGQRMTYVLCCSSVCANQNHSRKTVTFIYK